jgi:hypothetical protein
MIYSSQTDNTNSQVSKLMINPYNEVVLGINDDIRVAEQASGPVRIPILTVLVISLSASQVLTTYLRTGIFEMTVVYRIERANY